MITNPQSKDIHPASMEEVEDDATPFLAFVEQDPANLRAVKFKAELEVCAYRNSVALSDWPCCQASPV